MKNSTIFMIALGSCLSVMALGIFEAFCLRSIQHESAYFILLIQMLGGFLMLFTSLDVKKEKTLLGITALGIAMIIIALICGATMTGLK